MKDHSLVEIQLRKLVSLLNFVCHDMSASWSLSLALRTLGSLACDVGLLSKSRLLLTTVGLKLVKIYFFAIFYLLTSTIQITNEKKNSEKNKINE